MENIQQKGVKTVLKDTKRILKHHNELMIAKGEYFNLFSVLDIETKENKTHSAFLAMLLNPRGVHKMGSVFLELLLSVIQHNEKFENENNRVFHSDKATVKVEEGIGTIDLKKKKGEDPSTATGGRIDIYLRDKNFNIISIENKIHAGDQESQIQRYYNHETLKNTVYYLTLKGEDPNKDSRLELKSGADFYNISYKNEILEWLELCLREVPNFTALRESINQYILLIKKLTHTLNDKAEKELFDTMVDSMEESKYVADNYQKLVKTIRNDFRKEITKRLRKVLLSDKYLIEGELPINQNFSKLNIHYVNLKKVPFSFVVEPFSGSGNADGAMFVGLYGHNKALCKSIPEPKRLNEWWQHIKWIKTNSDNNFHLSSPNLLKKLYYKNSENPEKKEQYENLVSNICEQIMEFIKDTEPYLFKEFNK